MLENFIKSILNYFLHRVSKTTDVSNVTLELKKAKGSYVLGITSTVALSGEQIRKRQSRKVLIIFLVVLSLLIILDVIGILLPNASTGRTLVYFGEYPAFVVNIIAGRFVIKNISQRSRGAS